MLGYLKKLFKLLDRSEKLMIAFLFALMIIAALIEVVSVAAVPILVAVLSDPTQVLENERYAGVWNFFGIEDNQSLLIFGALLVFFAFVAKNAFLIIYKWISTSFLFGLYTRLGDKLFRMYMEAPYTFHLSRNSAELLRNVTQETQLMVVKFLFPFMKFVMDVGIVIGILLLLLSVDPLMTVVVFGVLGGGSMLFMRSLRNQIKNYGLQEQEYRARMIQSVNEGLGGLKDARVMGRGGFFVDRFHYDLDKTSKSFRFKEFIGQIIIPSVETFAVVGMLLMALFLFVQGKDLQSIIPLLALFITATARLMPAFKKTVNQYNVIKYHCYVVEPVYNDLKNLQESKKSQQSQSTDVAPLKLQDTLRFENVSYTYPGGSSEALNNVSLDIRKGQIVGFVGSSGAGKTTVVDVLLGLLEPQSGTVSVDGVDVFKHLSAWQKTIGYIPQSIYLSDDSIRKNIAFGLPDDKIEEEKISRAIASAQLSELIESLPEGIDTLIGEGGVRLSGGQRQRIGIARALYHDPEILIMDEATSALDNQTERKVMEQVEQLKEGRTIIMIAHRLSTVKNADILFLMDHGKLIQQGTYDDLLLHSETFKMMAAES